LKIKYRYTKVSEHIQQNIVILKFLLGNRQRDPRVLNFIACTNNTRQQG